MELPQQLDRAQPNFFTSPQLNLITNQFFEVTGNRSLLLLL
jgi:hypothetical protein